MVGALRRVARSEFAGQNLMLAALVILGMLLLWVVVVTTSDAWPALRLQIAERPWIEAIDAGQPLSMRRALRELKARRIETLSAIGGPRTARALLQEGVVHDLYVTTSPKSGGEPNTPLVEESGNRWPVVLKNGTGPETGVRFAHYALS